jgi:hypothetical protein
VVLPGKFLCDELKRFRLGRILSEVDVLHAGLGGQGGSHRLLTHISQADEDSSQILPGLLLLSQGGLELRVVNEAGFYQPLSQRLHPVSPEAFSVGLYVSKIQEGLDIEGSNVHAKLS